MADHEIAHSYFPFYMGINESRYAIMDEGWATTLELLIGRTELQGDSADAFYKNFRVRGWINDPSTEEDMAIINPANAVNGIAYGNNAYGKPSLGYLAMMDMLGPDVFGKSVSTSTWICGTASTPFPGTSSTPSIMNRDRIWIGSGTTGISVTDTSTWA